MTRFGYPLNLLISLTLFQSFLAPVAWSGSPQSQNPLLGTWRVEQLPGDNSAQALQCRTLSEIEVREKSIRMVPREADAEKSDDAQMSIAAALMGWTQQLSGQAQGAKIARVTYEKDGDDWFITHRDYDAPPLVLETRGENEMLMQDPKRPTTSEQIDWICALRKAGVDLARVEGGIPFLGTLLKTEQDVELVGKRAKA